jgi:hypothetical protein
MRGGFMNKTPNASHVFHSNLKPHSVEVKTSAKGEVSWSCKVYADDPMDALNQAVALHDELCKRFNTSCPSFQHKEGGE